MPGGNRKRGALRVLSFFCIYDNPDGDTRARVSFVILYFFRHINNETNKNRRGNFGVQGSPCPSESPVTFERFASIGTGLLICARDAEPPEKCTALYNQNEKMHY